jgi:2-polyprenyl-6-hydroxyphenyl methylase/3-demethylubiquinone-9 3-methyltransferase
VIEVARAHAAAQGLTIDYRAGNVRQLEGSFDLITSMEVIEHVADPAEFLKALASLLAADGLFVISTPNATAWSRLLMITVGEGLGHIPRGTHDFDKFIPPDRMKALLAEAGLKFIDIEGIAWSVTRGLHLSEDMRLNYLVAAVRA